jgi:hypothetical protein
MRLQNWLKNRKKPEPAPVRGFWDYVHRHPIPALAVLALFLFLVLASCSISPTVNEYPTARVGFSQSMGVLRAVINGDIGVSASCIETPKNCEIVEK